MTVPVLASLIATFLRHNPDFPTKNVPALLRRAKKIIPVAQIPKNFDYPLEDLLNRSELSFLADWFIALKSNNVNTCLPKFKQEAELNAIVKLLPRRILLRL